MDQQEGEVDIRVVFSLDVMLGMTGTEADSYEH